MTKIVSIVIEMEKHNSKVARYLSKANLGRNLVRSPMERTFVCFHETWTVKKAEHKRTDAFELWCWRTLEKPLDSKIKPAHPKRNQSWVFTGRTDVELETPIFWPIFFPIFCEVLTHLKRSWCWERLRAGGEVDDRGWEGWMASPTQWTWVWVSSRSWWWTGRPGVLHHGVAKSRTWLSD